MGNPIYRPEDDEQETSPSAELARCGIGAAGGWNRLLNARYEAWDAVLSPRRQGEVVRTSQRGDTTFFDSQNHSYTPSSLPTIELADDESTDDEWLPDLISYDADTFLDSSHNPRSTSPPYRVHLRDAEEDTRTLLPWAVPESPTAPRERPVNPREAFARSRDALERRLLLSERWLRNAAQLGTSPRRVGQPRTSTAAAAARRNIDSSSRAETWLMLRNELLRTVASRQQRPTNADSPERPVEPLDDGPYRDVRRVAREVLQQLESRIEDLEMRQRMRRQAQHAELEDTSIP